MSAGPQAFSVLGAGSWGTVLAQLLAQNGHTVKLWTRDPAHATAITRTRENHKHLPGFRIPDGVNATSNLREATLGARAVLLAVPVRATLALLAQLDTPQLLLSCAKGFPDESLTPLSTHMHARFPGTPVAVLSGPNLAHEIAAGMPAAATVAIDPHHTANAEALLASIQGWLAQEPFRVYTSFDVIGVQTSGAVKNVIALAAGMADALELGENSKAALLTRGLAELVRIGQHLGGEARTFYGLAGLGDLIATCAGSGSRNHRAGARIVAGESWAAIAASGLTAEGAYTVQHLHAYATVHGLDLPLTREVHAVVHEGKAPRTALRALMTRPATHE